MLDHDLALQRSLLGRIHELRSAHSQTEEGSYEIPYALFHDICLIHRRLRFLAALKPETTHLRSRSSILRQYIDTANIPALEADAGQGARFLAVGVVGKGCHHFTALFFAATEFLLEVLLATGVVDILGSDRDVTGVIPLFLRGQAKHCIIIIGATVGYTHDKVRALESGDVL